MKIVIDPNVLHNAQGPNGYGQTLQHVLNKSQYYCHTYTEELRVAYARVELIGQGTSQLVAAQLAKQLCLNPGGDLINLTIHRQIISPFLSAEEVCNDGLDCWLTESDKQLVRVAKSIVHESATALEEPKIIILVDCLADSDKRCLCQEAWIDKLMHEVPGTNVCHAADSVHLDRCLQKDTTLVRQQHQTRLEQLCGSWLDRKLRCYGQVNYKYRKMVNDKEREYEQDYFCDTEVNLSRHVYFGESKLFDDVDTDKVKELCEGIGQLKRGIHDLAQGEPQPARVECFLFSNSVDITDRRVEREARQLARTCGAIVHLYRVKMPDRWKSQPNWVLEDKDFVEVRL